MYSSTDENIEIVPLKNLEEETQRLRQQNQGLGNSLIRGLTYMFKYRFIAFIWDANDESFLAVKCNYEGMSTAQLRCVLGGEMDRNIQRQKFGPCALEVPKKSGCSLLVSEVLNPFYIFQVASVVLWFYERYILYSVLVIGISTFSIIISLYETIKNHEKVRQMAHFES